MIEPKSIFPLISICIPTYNRPDLLCVAINSCLQQSYSNIEILVGDDSKNDCSIQAIAGLLKIHGDRIRYFRNIPSLGQGDNVNNLFRLAKGDLLTLLHDDDFFYSNSLVALFKCWETYPDLSAAFGRQKIVDMKGTVLEKETERFNNTLFRTVDRIGLLPTPVEAGLRQMFPNNGYLVTSEIARRVGYRSFNVVGDACDYDFALRLCLQEKKICFCGDYISAYRYTDVAVSSNAITGHSVHHLLSTLNFPDDVMPILRWAKRHSAPTAVPAYALIGDWRNAVRILYSSDYRKDIRDIAKFVYHVMLVLGAITFGADGAKYLQKMMRKLFGV